LRCAHTSPFAQLELLPQSFEHLPAGDGHAPLSHSVSSAQLAPSGSDPTGPLQEA
jgi:hypothetical protein